MIINKIAVLLCLLERFSIADESEELTRKANGTTNSSVESSSQFTIEVSPGASITPVQDGPSIEVVSPQLSSPSPSHHSILNTTEPHALVSSSSTSNTTRSLETLPSSFSDNTVGVELPTTKEDVQESARCEESISPELTNHSISVDNNATSGEILEAQLRNLTGALESNDSSKLTDEEKSYFLTFEEWKKQKVAEESEEHSRKESEGYHEQRIRVSGQYGSPNNLDGAVGEENEFEATLFSNDDNSEDLEGDEGRMYKGRFNYASFDCAATIVKTNAEGKGANAVLNENKDSYFLNQCKAQNKYVIVELCEDILVDEVLIGNYEFFSSVFKDIRVSVSDRFPTTSWKLIGEFKAENLRKLQAFKIKDSIIWAKFLKIEILSYYGNEYYCPISSIQVHGKSMMEQFKEENHETSFSIPSNGEQGAVVKEEVMPDSIEFCLDLKSDQGDLLNLNSIQEEEDRCVRSPHLGLDQFLEGYKINELDTEQSLDSANSTNSLVVSTASSSSQESIYRNIIKRLSLLETNATLSLLYIEEQSKILSEAFENLENRQNGRFDKLIGQLNATIQAQVHNFRKLNVELAANFEQLFNYQNDKFQNLLSSSEGRLDSFQRSLSFQKKINFFNVIVIAFLLAYIVSAREGIESDYYLANQPSGNESPQSPSIKRWRFPHGTTVFSSASSLPDPVSGERINRSVSKLLQHRLKSKERKQDEKPHLDDDVESDSRSEYSYEYDNKGEDSGDNSVVITDLKVEDKKDEKENKGTDVERTGD
ncbi:DEKNAAC104898 [Brettanomyces naardenensis]|uniref:SUN-like protein 1 n=1 Tax=Brettanomyces naardenensis TaxID=13370 RepID=A0A448YRY4_BRENA|nr:DEKNAAC104898 [Brettanomyces naardenensis]